jgi:hypothetical protein
MNAWIFLQTSGRMLFLAFGTLGKGPQEKGRGLEQMLYVKLTRTESGTIQATNMVSRHGLKWFLCNNMQ